MSTRLEILKHRRKEVESIILSLSARRVPSNQAVLAAYRKELEKLEGQIETEKTAGI